MASATWGDGQNICKVCGNDCLDDMKTLKRVVCNNFYHPSCVYDNPNAQGHAIMFRNEFVCSDKCHQHVLPFCSFKSTDLIKAGILCPFQKDCLPPNQTLDKKKNFNKKFIKLDQFININCKYLTPNELNNGTLSVSRSDFTVFHNNIRSLNKNFEGITDIFQHCKELPNVLAFSETKLNEMPLLLI